MKGFYKSYYLVDNNKINLDEFNRSSYNYKVYFSPIIDCLIAEAYNEKKEIYWVIYYLKDFSDKIYDFHINSFGKDVKISLCNQLNNGVELIFFKDRKVSKYSVENYYDDGRPKLLQLFDGNFELVEYRKSIYNEHNIHIQEKIFFADSWTIHTEKMI